MTDVAALLRPEPKRGPHYGHQKRYKLRLPGEKKTRLRTRVTTFIKALDTSDNLIPWSDVCTLTGHSRQQHLRAQWAALMARHPNPWYDTDESKDEAKRIAKLCKEAGGATDRRDLGTALHDILADVITGRTTPSLVDPEFRWHVEAVLKAIIHNGYSIIPELSERSVYIKEWDLCGSFDLVLRRTSDGELVMADLKTGGQMWTPKFDYETHTEQVGWYDGHSFDDLKEAAQLASYALGHGLIVWPDDPEDECTLEPMPQVVQDEGIIIHAPATERSVALRRLDLDIGRQALVLCAAIRANSKATPLIERIGDDPPPLKNSPASATSQEASAGETVLGRQRRLDSPAGEPDRWWA